MDMDMDGGSSSAGPLSPAGVNFSNETQAIDFLAALLDDTELKVIGDAYARYFWYGVSAFVGVAAIVNLVRRLTLRWRLRAAARGVKQPAKPANAIMLCIATLTAMTREAAYLQFTPLKRYTSFRVPPVGTVALILGYFAFVLVLEFANNDVAGAQFWQARGVRAGWLAVAQVPLLILLVMKTDIIGLLTGVTHERLNVLHRWAARITLFLAILHFGYQSYGWQKFGLMTLEWKTDECPVTGIAAFALILWINISSLMPLRSWSYEIFVAQHIISFFGFIIATMMHLPSTALLSRVYIYIPIGLYLIDRIARSAWFAYYNSSGSTATLTSLDGGVTKITVFNKRVQRWTPGSFVLLSIPKFGMLESHPATIVSTPSSRRGEMTFLLKSHKGFTRRLMDGANSDSTMLLPRTKQERDSGVNDQKTSYRAFINGPYGGSQSDFAAFDSVCLITGSTGVTFALSILQDLADRAAGPDRLPLRRLHFVWCVRDVSWTRWCNDEISGAVDKLRAANIATEISIHVTCVDAFTEPGSEAKECDCACDKSLGPCCCVVVQDSDDEDGSDDDDRAAKAPNEKISENSNLVAKGAKLPVLPCASFYSGRPDIANILLDVVEGAEGESGVGVCGPIAMSAEVRGSVVRLSDERAIHKGSGCQGLYLHVESFS